MRKYNEIEILKTAKSIAIISHSNPDADALCSMVVLKKFLVNNFNIDTIDLFAETHHLSETYYPILDNETLNNQIGKYDFIITLDCANPALLGSYEDLFLTAQNTLVIDHHNTNSFYGKTNVVEYCSSTCELIFKILKEYNYQFSDEDYGRIYAGIITDTNNFTVGNLNKTTFEIAGECYEHSNCQNIYTHFFTNNELKNQKLFACAIQNAQPYDDGRIIISKITIEESKRLNADNDDYLGIVNRLAQTKHSQLVCFIYPKNNCLYVSMRARKGYDVSEIAKRHGGGGHIGAAAFESSDNLGNIESLILRELRNEILQKNIKFHRNPFKQKF